MKETPLRFLLDDARSALDLIAKAPPIPASSLVGAVAWLLARVKSETLEERRERALREHLPGHASPAQEPLQPEEEPPRRAKVAGHEAMGDKPFPLEPSPKLSPNPDPVLPPEVDAKIERLQSTAYDQGVCRDADLPEWQERSKTRKAAAAEVRAALLRWASGLVSAERAGADELAKVLTMLEWTGIPCVMCGEAMEHHHPACSLDTALSAHRERRGGGR